MVLDLISITVAVLFLAYGVLVLLALRGEGGLRGWPLLRTWPWTGFLRPTDANRRLLAWLSLVISAWLLSAVIGWRVPSAVALLLVVGLAAAMVARGLRGSREP